MSKRSQPEEVAAVIRLATAVAAAGDVEEAAATVVRLTADVPLVDSSRWELLFRSQLPYALSTQRPTQWKWWVRPAQCPPWFLLCSASGYDREEALRNLSGPAPNALLLLMALRRLNDWVPEVRIVAGAALRRVAATSDPDVVVEALCAILPVWHHWRRIEDVGCQVVVDLLSLPAIGPALATQVLHSPTGPMPAILGQLGRCPVFDDRMGEFARDAVQPAVRAKAYRSLFEGWIGWSVGRRWHWIDKRWCKGRVVTVTNGRRLSSATPFLETLRAASADDSPLVRSIAGEFLIRELKVLGASARELANRLAADASPTVASRGRFALAQLDEIPAGTGKGAEPANKPPE